MDKVIMADGIQYKSKTTGEIFTLKRDYNGKWYLKRRDEEGLKKTLSYPENIMCATLSTSYDIV